MKQKTKKEIEKDDPNGYKAASIRNCYAYRNWLWITHNRTYEEEMDRAFSLI